MKIIGHSGFKEYGIINPATGEPYSRPHIDDMIADGVFPPKYSISPGRVGWRVEDLDLWLASRPLAGDPQPILWPVRPRVRKERAADAKPVGRPRGSRVVDGRLVLADAAEPQRRMMRRRTPASGVRDEAPHLELLHDRK